MYTRPSSTVTANTAMGHLDGRPRPYSELPAMPRAGDGEPVRGARGQFRLHVRADIIRCKDCLAAAPLRHVAATDRYRPAPAIGDAVQPRHLEAAIHVQRHTLTPCPPSGH